MRGFLIVVLSSLFGLANAQSLNVSLIPEELKKDASVVIRSSKTEFNIVNPGKAIETRHLELTILNDNGTREAYQVVPYSDLEKVLSVSGELYDKHGKRVKKIKNGEIEDVSASGSNMYTDNRLKVLDFSYPEYPYSIVLDYKVEHSGLMFYPTWYPQDSRATSVIHSEFLVTVPSELGLNFFEQRVTGEQEVIDGNNVYSWAISDLPAFDAEPYSPPFRDLVPMVMLTPKTFEMEGYSGSMSTWELIGAYENELLKGKQEIPPALLTEVDMLIEGVEDRMKRAEIIYKFVQNSTRYVSVQLGIGGWEPYDVNYVYENGYGDCKALTNYTMALLDYAGVPSIYTSVYAGNGKPDIVTDFPNARFNHVFLAVPNEQDTVWLECTSQPNPFGYLGTFTSDRHVLMATDKGGVLVKTPTYTEEDNTQIRKVTVELMEDGNAKATVSTVYKGLQYENVDHQLYNSYEEQKKWLQKNLKMKGLSVVDFTYSENADKVPSITETIELEASGFATKTGSRIFFDVNPLNRYRNIPKKVEDRKSNVHIDMAYQDIDSVFYKIPEGFHVEHLPESIEISEQFGKYSAEFHKSADGILYIRKIVRYKGVYPPESYNDFREMVRNIVRSDKTKVVLAGNT